IRKSPSPCLQGNFRLGQLHLNAGSPRSIEVRYGWAALPLHSPHRADSERPRLVQRRSAPSSRPALAAEGSGARARTCSGVQDIEPGAYLVPPLPIAHLSLSPSGRGSGRGAQLSITPDRSPAGKSGRGPAGSAGDSASE